MISVFVSSAFSIEIINHLIIENHYTLDQVAKVSPATHVVDFYNNINYLQKIRLAKLVIVKDAHLIFPKADFKLKVMLEFLNLSADLWLLVPSIDLLHQLILESVSRVKEIDSNQIQKHLSYNNNLSWVDDDLISRLSNYKGIIFWGESGVGKSHMALELAESMNGTVIGSRCFDLVHGGVGESEKELENLFKRAKDSKPSIIVVDDLDTLFKPRGISGDLANKMVAQLILELDEIQFYQEPILFLGTAVIIQDLDESLWKRERLYLHHVERFKEITHFPLDIVYRIE